MKLPSFLDFQVRLKSVCGRDGRDAELAVLVLCTTIGKRGNDTFFNIQDVIRIDSNVASTSRGGRMHNGMDDELQLVNCGVLPPEERYTVP